MLSEISNISNYDDDYDPAESPRKDMERERKICPICNSGNGHSLSCATLNVAGDVVELDAIEIQDRPERLLSDKPFEILEDVIDISTDGPDSGPQI